MEARAVRKMEQEFQRKVNAVAELALEAKKKKKLDKNKKILENLELCLKHDGPLAISTLHKLDSLSDEQVMAEAKYLKKTIAPNLRFKRLEGGHFINFTIDQIKQQVRDSIQPQDPAEHDLSVLLANIFDKAETSKDVSQQQAGGKISKKKRKLPKSASSAKQ